MTEIVFLVEDSPEGGYTAFTISPATFNSAIAISGVSPKAEILGISTKWANQSPVSSTSKLRVKPSKSYLDNSIG